MDGLLIGIGSFFIVPAVSAGLMIISRIVSNEKIDAFGIAIGKKITDAGRKRLGRGWELIEDFLENGVMRLVLAIFKGWNYDDKKKEKK